MSNFLGGGGGGGAAATLGPGTTNKLVKWASPTTIGDSSCVDSGTKLTCPEFESTGSGNGNTKYYDADGSNYVQLGAPDTVGTDLSIKLPATAATGILHAVNAAGVVSESISTIVGADLGIKFSKSFSILTPTAADTNFIQMAFPSAITITRVYCSTDTGTATMNLDERAEATPNTAGTNVLSADIVCDNGTRTSCAAGCDVNTITNGTIAANVPLNVQITSVASTPGVVRFHIDYTVD